MSTTSVDVSTSLTKVSQQQRIESAEESIPEFSPFSCLSGLNTTPPTHPDLARETQTPSVAESYDELVVQESETTSIHVSRDVFTIRAGQEDESVYLNEQFRELEARQGLVTLSADTGKDQEKDLKSQPIVTSETVDKSSGPRSSEPSGTQEEAPISDQGQDDVAEIEVNTCISTVANKCISSSREDSEKDSRFALDGHNKTFEEPAPENCDFAVNPLKEEETSKVSSGCQAETSQSDAAVFVNGFGDTVISRDSCTQTEAIAFSPTVDFYLWEQRRLACNGWGIHGHEGSDLLQCEPVSDSLLNCTNKQASGDQAKISSHERPFIVNSNPQKRNNLTTSKNTKATKIVNTSTQTRSPSIKPSCLQINKQFHANKPSRTHQTEVCSAYFKDHHQNSKSVIGPSHSLNDIERGRIHPSDTPASLSGHSTPFDSVSTTPRALDKIPDALNSFRSASVLSDSGTSSSIPSDIINSAKPFTNRIHQNKSTCQMEAVSSNPSSTQTTPPPSARDNSASPPSSPQAPTLKVEYVTKVWDAYISDFLLDSDHIRDAAIFDRATATCIAASLDFLITAEEFQQLQRSLSNLVEATRHGVTLQGRRYKTFLADGRRGLMAKGAKRSGCSACQTRTLVLVAVHDHTGKPARCNEEVMRLGDFFWAKGL